MISEIELNPSERELVAQITLDGLKLSDGGQPARANGDLVCRLMHSLLTRKGIPEARIRFFIDPEYNIGGRGSSREAIFEGNGTRGEDIFRDGNFLKHLRYLLFGADLPPEVKASFAAKVKECGQITSGDVVPLGHSARELARKDRSKDPVTASDEFFKLALDLGLDHDYADSIRRAVRQGRW